MLGAPVTEATPPGPPRSILGAPVVEPSVPSSPAPMVWATLPGAIALVELGDTGGASWALVVGGWLTPASALSPALAIAADVPPCVPPPPTPALPAGAACATPATGAP